MSNLEVTFIKKKMKSFLPEIICTTYEKYCFHFVWCISEENCRKTLHCSTFLIILELLYLFLFDPSSNSHIDRIFGETVQDRLPVFCLPLSFRGRKFLLKNICRYENRTNGIWHKNNSCYYIFMIKPNWKYLQHFLWTQYF